MKTFSEVVEEVKKWDNDLLTELEAIIRRQLAAKKRKSIKQNYINTKQKEAQKLSYSSDIETLKRRLA
jgi:hypothetical protein